MKTFDDYIFDTKFTDHPYVITGACALARNGLIMASLSHLALQTKYELLDNVAILPVTYYYNPDIDYEYEVVPSRTNPLLLLPSKERALVEYVRDIDKLDEAFLIEGLKEYIGYFYDEEKLYAAADHFGVPHSEIEYWLNEARLDCEV